MFPVVSNVSTATPQPQTLVGSPLPETVSALHVSPVDVSGAPPNVQINNNNARGNGGAVVAREISAPASSANHFDVTPSVARTPFASSPAASPMFIAQLIGQRQDVPQALQDTLSNVLALYDEIVARKFVQYKPSNATLPPPAPSGVFGRILQQSAPVEHPQPVELPRTEPVRREVQAESASVLRAATASDIRVELPRQRPVQSQRPVAALRAPAFAAAAAKAYSASNERVAAEAPDKVTESA